MILVCALASTTAIPAICTPDAWAQESALNLIEIAQAPEEQKHNLYYDYAVRSEFVLMSSTEDVGFAMSRQDLATIHSSSDMETHTMFSDPIYSLFSPDLTVTHGVQSTTATIKKSTYVDQAVSLGGAMLHSNISVTVPTISQPDRAPSISAIQGITLTPGTSASRQVTASDPDGDTVRLSISSNPSFVSISDSGDGMGTVTVSPPVSVATGTYTMTVTATAGSLSVSTPFTVMVTSTPDTSPPRITPPTNVTAEATGARTAVSIGMATATDNRDGAVTATSNAPATFPLGITTVIWTAKDVAGNSATAVQTVTVQDTTAPLVTAPSDVSVEAVGTLTSVMLGTATSTDAVDSSVDVTDDAPPGFPLGITTVTWTATDDSGNSAMDTQLVTILDTTPPDIVVPEMRTFEATGPLTELDSDDYGIPEITDAFGFASSSDAPYSFPLGTTIITHSAIDVHGNLATAIQRVTLADTTPPYFASELETVYTSDSDSGAVEFTVPAATDL